MVGSNGNSFAQRIIGTRPTTISDSDSSDGCVSESKHEGQGDIRNNIPSLISSDNSESDTNGSLLLSQKSTKPNLGAKELARGYDPGNPYKGSEAEPEQPAVSHAAKKASEEGNYAEKSLAAAREDLNRMRLEDEEIEKMIEQGRITRRELARKMDDISGFMGTVEKYCL